MLAHPPRSTFEAVCNEFEHDGVGLIHESDVESKQVLQDIYC